MRLADPDVANNNCEYQKIAKSLAELEEVYQTYQRFKECEAQLEEAQGKFIPYGWLANFDWIPVCWVLFRRVSWKGLWEWVPELVKDAAGDREMADMAAEEVKMLSKEAEELEEALKVDMFLKPWFLTLVNQKYHIRIFIIFFLEGDDVWWFLTREFDDIYAGMLLPSDPLDARNIMLEGQPYTKHS
jgi:protein subunit release factor A